ncbi:MFS transporter [Pelagicoccus mobilis]|uniref:MFS transporter n=1 Tax=Pelagicoccus mobilis TaxID=415221 RepID=A0A934RZ31_9BACT|nr:MFS transporter [Pelagicoccus mobilis]MBK1876957.1 MFS transporter [Pelagicoccus mobilis]
MPHGKRSTLWASLFCVNLVNSTQAAIALVGVPSHALTENFDDHQLALLLGSFPVAAGISALFSGTLSDLLGRRVTLLTGLLLLSICLLSHALAPDFNALLLLRILGGLATGALTGLPSTLLSDSLPKSEQLKANGKMLSGHALGQSIGIPLGIALLQWLSYLQLCSGLGALTLVLTLAIRYHLPSRNPSAYYQSGTLSSYLKKSLRTLADKRFALLTLSSYLGFTASALFYISLTLWFLEKAKIEPNELAPIHMLGGLLQAIVLISPIRTALNWSPSQTIALSFFINTAIFGVATISPPSLALSGACFSLTLGAVALRISPLLFAVNNLGPSEHKGLRMSVVQTSNHLGKATGYAVASYLALHLDLHKITLLCGILTLLSGLIFLGPRFREVFAPSTSVHHPSSKSSNLREGLKTIKKRGFGTYDAN